jgi:hypothetical protein
MPREVIKHGGRRYLGIAARYTEQHTGAARGGLSGLI